MTSTKELRWDALSRRNYRVIPSASKSGKPNVSPKGSFRVVDDERVVFANIASPRTLANLKENPQLTAIIFERSTRKGCRIWGKAEILEN